MGFLAYWEAMGTDGYSAAEEEEAALDASGTAGYC
jgi:hypothetical protein